MGRDGEAIAVYQHILCLKPGLLEVYAPLCALLVQNGKLPEFLQLIDQLNRIDPEEARKLSQRMLN